MSWAMADEFGLKGLDLKREEETESLPKNAPSRQISPGPINPTTTSKDKKTQRLPNDVVTSQSTETAVALNDFPSESDLEELDTKVKSMMSFSKNQLCKQKGRGRICNVCENEVNYGSH